jgi:Pyridoxamine 5'-phosphate oxidase
MGKQFTALTEDQIAFIGQQHLFFVATAAPEGKVNLSPKGMDALRVISPNRILWLNLTGSGNETAAHLALSPRMTLMWCSFTTRPVILRCYGTARALHRADAEFAACAARLPDQPGARQVVEVTVDLVQSSCGFAVPFMEFVADRPVLKSWAEDKGAAGLRDYWRDRNTTSLDGLPTGIAANLEDGA